MNPNSYQRPLLFVSQMLTSVANKLTRNMIGAIIPCQTPLQKPAGSAPGCLYFESEPATERAFAIGAGIINKRANWSCRTQVELGENDGFVAVEEDAVFNVPADGAR